MAELKAKVTALIDRYEGEGWGDAAVIRQLVTLTCPSPTDERRICLSGKLQDLTSTSRSIVASYSFTSSSSVWPTLSSRGRSYCPVSYVT